MIQARFNPTAGDFEDFGRRSLAINRMMLRRTMISRARVGAGALRVVALLTMVLALASSLYLTFAADIKWGFAAFFAGLFLWALLASQLGVGAAKRARAEFEKDPRRGDEVTAEADERGFRYWSKWVRYELGWEAVAGVYGTRDRLFVFDQDRLTYVVPRRGFGSEEDSRRFETWVDQRAAFKP